jgi:hypothetical protein
MEVIDLGLKDMEPISLNLDQDSRPSVNFGPGIELLMNEKKKNSFSNTNVDLGDLDKLEEDLNELSGGASVAGSYSNAPVSGSSSGTKSLNFGGGISNMFGWGGGGGGGGAPKEEPGIKLSMEDINDSGLGEATAQSFSGYNKSHDGFSKLNTEIPIEYSNSVGSRMNDREKRRKKRLMIKKLEEWYEKGVIKHTSHFNMDSNYEEVEDEYEGAMEDKRKKDSVKIYGWWFMTFVNSVEYANAAFNPFDLNLDGWGEQVNEDLDSYEELFGELYQKYKGGKMAPEIALLLRLGFSAAVVNFTNKALSTATPAFNDVIRQSPELMKMFTNATVQSMSQASPGFNMASSMMNNREPDVNTQFGPPPAPVATKNQAPPPRNPMATMQFTQRPDIAAARGPMFREPGVDIQQKSGLTPQSMPSPAPAPQKRPEMRGPQNMDLDQILSGLKTREVSLQEEPKTVPSGPPVTSTPMNIPVATEAAAAFPVMVEPAPAPASSSILNENDSMISISSLRDMQNASMPKRSRRKQRSDRNTVSLDI